MVNLRSIDQELNSLAKKRGMLSTEVPKDVTDSWKRCIQNDLDPSGKPELNVLSSRELSELRDKNDIVRNPLITKILKKLGLLCS